MSRVPNLTDILLQFRFEKKVYCLILTLDINYAFHKMKNSHFMFINQFASRMRSKSRHDIEASNWLERRVNMTMIPMSIGLVQ